MGFLNDLIGGFDNTVLTVVLALAIVLVLIVIGVWLLKLIFNATGKVGRGRNRRLSVIDTMAIDQKRQLLLIRRDDTEHLLVIGGNGDLVVETGITPPQAATAPLRKPLPARGVSKPANTDEKPAKASRSLRHTGLLRTNDRAEPELHPQTLSDEPRFDAEIGSDSASNFQKAEETEIIVEPETNQGLSDDSAKGSEKSKTGGKLSADAKQHEKH